jgi:TPR repeat protein
MIFFEEAAKLGHPGAKEHVAFAHLFGDHLPHNVHRAKDLLQELAVQGSPKAQMVCIDQSF